MKKIQVQGKDYIEVNERLKEFRSLHPLWSIESFLVQIDEKACIIQTHIKDETGRIISTGLARERDGDTFINKTSFVENCETSAVGRALGILGIGIDTSVASYEEVANAQLNQNKDNKLEKNINEVFEIKHNELIKENPNLNKCKDCGSELVLNPKTGKLFCKEKCFIKKNDLPF